MHTERRYGGLKLNVSHSAKIPRRNEGLNQMRMNLWLTSIPAQPNPPSPFTKHPIQKSPPVWTLVCPVINKASGDEIAVVLEVLWPYPFPLWWMLLAHLVIISVAHVGARAGVLLSPGLGHHTHTHTVTHAKTCTNTHATQQTNQDRDRIQLKWLSCAWVTHMFFSNYKQYK